MADSLRDDRLRVGPLGGEARPAPIGRDGPELRLARGLRLPSLTKVSALILLATTSLVAYAAVSVEQVWLVPLALWTAFATYLNAYSALKQQG